MIALLTLNAALAAPMQAADIQSGALEYRVGNELHTLPMVRTEVDADLHGDLATVRLVQTFANPESAPLNATYAFPLPSDAAVHGMELIAGDLVVTAQIKESAEAKATFETAKRQGKQAALLTQHRPNVFTQDIANLPPGTEIRVTVEYVHPIPKVDGAFEWVFPVAVGPRYVPAERDHTGEPEPLEMGAWNVAGTGTDVQLPLTIESGRLAVDVALHGGTAITDLRVDSHPTARIQKGSDIGTVKLSGSQPNRDLVVRYQLADDDVAVATTAWAEDGRGIVNLLIDPPASVTADRITPREVVYVLDTSGSMSGAPMDAVKRFVHRSLDTLRAGDHFRLVRFGNNATEFGQGAVPWNPETEAAAHAWIDALQAGGGTEMRTGVNTALDAPSVPGTVRTVVFLTDGYIGNDVDVIRLLESKDSDARLFSFGIGGSVNRWLLEELARVGHGTARIVTDPTQADDAADALADRMAAPYLTDVRIDWGDAPIREATPEQLPDLFLGEPLRVMAKFDKAGSYPIAIHGKVAGSPATLPIRLELPAQSSEGEALPLTWARSRIADDMHRYLSPMTAGPEREQIRQQVTTLGLEYGLATQWTSFVAVVPEPVMAQNTAAPQPVHLPSSGSSASWGGSAAPEPAGWAAMGLMGVLGLLVNRRRRRKA